MIQNSLRHPSSWCELIMPKYGVIKWKISHSVFLVSHCPLFSLARTDYVPVPHAYTSYHEYPTMEAHYNRSYYARTLPPVPKNCPTPFGVSGK